MQSLQSILEEYVAACGVTVDVASADDEAAASNYDEVVSLDTNIYIARHDETSLLTGDWTTIYTVYTYQTTYGGLDDPPKRDVIEIHKHGNILRAVAAALGAVIAERAEAHYLSTDPD